MSRAARGGALEWFLEPAPEDQALVRAALDDANPTGSAAPGRPSWRLESATPRRSVFDAREHDQLLRLVRYAPVAASTPAERVAANWSRCPLGSRDDQALLAAAAAPPPNSAADAPRESIVLWRLPAGSEPLKRCIKSPKWSEEDRERIAGAIIELTTRLADAGFTGFADAARTMLVDLDPPGIILWEMDLLSPVEGASEDRRALGRDQRAGARLAARVLAPAGRSLEDLGLA